VCLDGRYTECSQGLCVGEMTKSYRVERVVDVVSQGVAGCVLHRGNNSLAKVLLHYDSITMATINTM